MSNFCVVLVTICLMIPKSFASVAIQYLPENPRWIIWGMNELRFVVWRCLRDYPGQCVDIFSGNAHAVGEAWDSEDDCMQIQCNKRGSQLYLSYTGCGLVSISDSENCEIVQDHGKAYPQCCPQIRCKNDQEVHNQAKNFLTRLESDDEANEIEPYESPIGEISSLNVETATEKSKLVFRKMIRKVKKVNKSLKRHKTNFNSFSSFWKRQHKSWERSWPKYRGHTWRRYRNFQH